MLLVVCIDERSEAPADYGPVKAVRGHGVTRLCPLAGLRSQHGRPRHCCGTEFVPKILDLTMLQVAPWFALIRQFAAPQVG
jgi:hypothetical protein